MDDFFSGHIDKDDPFGMKEWEQHFEKMNVENAIANFKREKKEPIKRRRDLYLEAMYKVFVDNLAEDLTHYQKSMDENLDKYIQTRIEQYDENIVKPAEEYYSKLLKEIDDMKVRVVKKSPE